MCALLDAGRSVAQRTPPATAPARESPEPKCCGCVRKSKKRKRPDDEDADAASAKRPRLIVDMILSFSIDRERVVVPHY